MKLPWISANFVLSVAQASKIVRLLRNELLAHTSFDSAFAYKVATAHGPELGEELG